MQKVKKAIFPVLASIAVLALSAAEVYNMRPFGTGAYLALLVGGVPVYITAPVYLLSQALFVSVPSELWGYLGITLVGVAVKLVFMKLKKPLPQFMPAVVGAVGSCAFVYAGITGILTPLNIILSALFSLLFMLVCQIFLKPLSARDSYAALTEPEKLSGCVILAALFLALARPVVSTFTLAYLFAASATLFAVWASGTGAGMITALSAGCGMAFYSFDPAPIAVLTFAAAVAAVFKDGHRFLCSAGYLLGFTIAVFLFTESDIFAVVSAFVGCLVYALVPAKLLKRARLFGYGAKKAALIASYNRERRTLGGELLTTAEIFGQMSRVMMGAGGMELDCDGYAKRLLTEVCQLCSYKAECKCNDIEIMERLVRRALEDGQTSVGGMPEEVLEHCRSIGALIGKVNAFVEKNRDDISRDRAYTSAARLCSSQLGGAEGVMRRLGTRLVGDAVFDTAGEDKIVEELVYGGISCLGATVRQAGGDHEISVIVREAAFDKAKVAAVMKKRYKRPFFFVSSDTAYAPSGYVCARFKSGAPLDVVFGASQIGKDGSGFIGDKYSFTRIGANGFMMAISDGMGTGKKASEISETAVSLVENYYRAGFDSAFVLSSVNRFLSLGRGDVNFSAMDILVLNLSTLGGDVIKIGSPPMRIKRGSGVARIGGGSLPLGALEEITPYSESVRLEEGDMIVMVSDGVEDAFDDGALEALISAQSTLNPQTLSRAVLDTALKNYGGVQRDDMTVLCGRIYRR
ncbi:MAG: SpoIIE family protein phosphatase [Clostridia bacterium]|nr:SpoIIE family protein phosphatase [Clostridia bacterium]